MSKIYEALQRSRAERDEAIAAVLEGGTVAVRVPLPVLEATPAEAAVIPETCPEAAPAELDAAPQPRSGTRSVEIALQPNSPVLPFNDHHWHASEQYRMIRTKIAQHAKKPRVIVVSSADAGDGKSVTSINLAGALALKDEAKVILVDADFRKSTVPKALGITTEAGLADVLTGSATLTDAIVQIADYPNLYVLPAGKAEANPAEMLDSQGWKSVAEELRRTFEFVIIDSPPVAAVADYDLLQAAADAVVMVVRPDHTNRRVCLRGLNAIPKDKMLGVILNCTKDWFLAGAYGYKYSSYYQYRQN